MEGSGSGSAGSVSTGTVSGASSVGSFSSVSDAESASFDDTSLQDFESDVDASDSTQNGNAQPANELDSLVGKPGTAHDKLEELANLPDDSEEEVPEQADPAKDDFNPKKETDEETLMRLQREALGLAMRRLTNEVPKSELDKEVKELLAQLKYLLEKLSQEGEKKTLVGSILEIALLLLTVGANAEQKLEKELKAA